MFMLASLSLPPERSAPSRQGDAPRTRSGQGRPSPAPAGEAGVAGPVAGRRFSVWSGAGSAGAGRRVAGCSAAGTGGRWLVLAWSLTDRLSTPPVRASSLALWPNPAGPPVGDSPSCVDPPVSLVTSA